MRHDGVAPDLFTYMAQYLSLQQGQSGRLALPGCVSDFVGLKRDGRAVSLDFFSRIRYPQNRNTNSYSCFGT
jgi:hypothetical protein